MAPQKIWINRMYADTLRCEEFSPEAIAEAAPVAAQRVSAEGRISFKKAGTDGKQTRINRLYQQGSAKIRLPQSYSDQAEAVLINTAGGLTGGDHLTWDIELGEGSNVVATTQACEKIYRSAGGVAHVECHVRIGADAQLDWLPQETIVYNNSALRRSLTVEMDANARLLVLESVVLGRSAMGESVEKAFFHDRWRIRKEGQLVHAEDNLFNLDEATSLSGRALLNGAGCFASMVYLGPESDEELEAIADELQKECGDSQIGFSAFNGKLVVRMVADNYDLKPRLVPVINRLRGDRPLPRVWEM